MHQTTVGLVAGMPQSSTPAPTQDIRVTGIDNIGQRQSIILQRGFYLVTLTHFYTFISLCVYL